MDSNVLKHMLPQGPDIIGRLGRRKTHESIYHRMARGVKRTTGYETNGSTPLRSFSPHEDFQNCMQHVTCDTCNHIFTQAKMFYGPVLRTKIYLAVAECLSVRRETGGVGGFDRPFLPNLRALVAVVPAGMGMGMELCPTIGGELHAVNDPRSCATTGRLLSRIMHASI